MMKLTSLDLLLYLQKTYGLYSATLLRKAVTIKSILSRFEHKLETTAIATTLLKICIVVYCVYYHGAYPCDH